MSNPTQVPDANRVLAALLDVSDDAIITTDLDGIVRTWSLGAARLYGYAAVEMMGQSMTRLVPEGQQAIVAANFARTRTGQHVEHFETVRVDKVGHVVNVSAKLSPILDEAGTPIGALSVSRDIRSRKRSDAALQASQARWRAVIESAVDGIVVIDERGRIEAFNRAAERLFGYDESEVLGKNVNVLMPSPYHEEHDEYLARYLREGNARVIGVGREVTGRRKDGTTFPVHLSVGEMLFEGERRFTGILHDLSDRVRMEAQLREREGLAKLGEMAAVLAHEVKNPLAGIRGAVQIIGSRLEAGSPEVEVTREVITRIDALNSLMTDLLLFSREPSLRPGPIEIRPLVVATAGLFAADPALNGVTVEVDGAVPVINADAGLLRIAFANLLLNAAHAMKGHGTIRVSLATTGDSCRITIRDSGPGIPAHVREKIFTPFFTTKARGTGLGLPTAKRLIEAHRGSIALECPPDGGTTVTVRLPFQ